MKLVSLAARLNLRKYNWLEEMNHTNLCAEVAMVCVNKNKPARFRRRTLRPLLKRVRLKNNK
jgi:hypothetical protein